MTRCGGRVHVLYAAATEGDTQPTHRGRCWGETLGAPSMRVEQTECSRNLNPAAWTLLHIRSSDSLVTPCMSPMPSYSLAMPCATLTNTRPLATARTGDLHRSFQPLSPATCTPKPPQVSCSCCRRCMPFNTPDAPEVSPPPSCTSFALRHAALSDKDCRLASSLSAPTLADAAARTACCLASCSRRDMSYRAHSTSKPTPPVRGAPLSSVLCHVLFCVSPFSSSLWPT